MQISGIIERLTAIRDENGEVVIEWRSEHGMVPRDPYAEPSTNPVAVVDIDTIALVAIHA